MKKKPIYFLCTLSLAVLLASCEEGNEVSSPAQLTVEETTVSVPSDAALLRDPFAEETPVVTDTVWVNATRSWTARIETADGGDWIRSNVDERINVTGKPEKYPLVVTFDRYRGNQPREATLTLFGVDIEEPVVINYTQEAYTPTLEVSTLDGGDIVTSESGETYAIVKSNTSWTVTIDEASSTVVPSLSATTGIDTQAILVTFPINPDDEKARIVRLVVKAADCEDQTLDLIQTQSERYFLLASPVEENRKPYESSINIPLRSNGPWTAEISDCTFEDAKLTPAAGLLSSSGFTFEASHGADPEVEEKHATITISREGMDPIVVKLSQQGSIHLNVMSYDPEYEYTGHEPYSIDTPYRPYKSNGYPFVYPASLPYSYSVGTYKGVEVECGMKAGDYSFIMYGQDCGVWLNSQDMGICVGKMKGDYVLFPGIEGYRLVSMYYEASCNTATPYTVRTEEGDILKGGEYSKTKQVYPLTAEHHDVHVHHFSETLPGERYRLTLEEDLRFISIKELCLVYEK